MKPEQAEIIALQALAWIVSEDELRDVYLGASGATVDDLRTRAGETEFQAAVLDFLLMDDDWVIRFCDANALNYKDVYEAQQSLPGQGQVHWT